MNASDISVVDPLDVTSSTSLFSTSESNNELVSDTLTWKEILISVFLSFIIILTIAGNILVILSIFTYGPLRNVQNFFIVSLAAADLTVAIFVMPFHVVYISIHKWIFGFHFCQIWLSCDIMCCTASILSLCAIAFDRYNAISNPLQYAQKRTMKRVAIMVGLVWGISAAICAPPLLGWNDWPEKFTEGTPCQLTSERGFIIYSSFGSFYIPLIIMIFLYVKIFTSSHRFFKRARKSSVASRHSGKIKLKNSKEKDPQFVASSSERATVGGSGETPPHCGNVVEIDPMPSESKTNTDESSSGHPQENDFTSIIQQKQKISLSKERRLARTLGIIMGTFVVCWLPFFLMYVILPFCPSCEPPSKTVENIITWLGYLNSALNPIIYTVFNKDFKIAFKRLLQCRCFRKLEEKTGRV